MLKMVEDCVEPKPENFKCGACGNIVPYNETLECSFCKDQKVEE